MKEIIKTERLILEKVGFKHLDDLHNLCSKEEVNIYNPVGAIKDKEETKSMLNQWIKDWKKYGIGYFIVKTKSDDFLGYIGLRYFQLKGEKVLNLAYRIEPKHWRKGYVFEACKKIIDSREDGEKTSKIMVLTKSENKPSIGVAKKLGFVYDKSFDDYPDKGDVYLFG